VQRFAEVAGMDQQKCVILRPAAVAQEKIAV